MVWVLLTNNPSRIIYFATYNLILSGMIISFAELIANKRSKGMLAKRLELFGRVFQPFFVLAAIGIFFICMFRSATAKNAQPQKN
jgi:heme/copper-type cytochrome/quinol oxidase subunit 3